MNELSIATEERKRKRARGRHKFLYICYVPQVSENDAIQDAVDMISSYAEDIFVATNAETGESIIETTQSKSKPFKSPYKLYEIAVNVFVPGSLSYPKARKEARGTVLNRAWDSIHVRLVK